jgi:hypothetical protein
MPTFKSGAFAQQCFSSHPHSLTFKSLTAFSPSTTPARPGVAISPTCPEPAETGSIPIYRIVLTCNVCDMRHRFVIQTLTSRLGRREERDTEAISQLSSCATAHCLDLRVSNMDVINDSVALRCGECHRAYHLGVSAIETYQK